MSAEGLCNFLDEQSVKNQRISSYVEHFRLCSLFFNRQDNWMRRGAEKLMKTLLKIVSGIDANLRGLLT